jgi:hypothetical protein
VDGRALGVKRNRYQVNTPVPATMTISPADRLDRN